MKNEVIREFSTAELQELLINKTEQFVTTRLNNAVSPIENTNEMRDLKKVVARVKTELRKRQLEEQKS